MPNKIVDCDPCDRNKDPDLNGTLIKWKLIKKDVCKTQGNLELNHFLFSNMARLFFFWSPGTTPDAKIGLWTLRPRSSAVFPSQNT